MYHLQKSYKHIKSCFSKWFSKQIRHIVICVDLLQVDKTAFKAVSNEMHLDINMLGFRVLYGILNNLNCSFIITKNSSVKKIQTVIQQLMLHPDDLRAASQSSYILSFSSGCGHSLLFLALPRN